MTPNVIEPLKNFLVDVSTLVPDPANARSHNQRNIDAIKESFASQGQHQPLIVQRDGMIVRIGNGRLQAAKALGWNQIAAIIVDESNVDAIARGIADNKTAELATWDFDVLTDVLKSLNEDGFDLQKTGWADFEIESFLISVSEDVAPVNIDADLSNVDAIVKEVPKQKMRSVQFTEDDFETLELFAETQNETNISAAIMALIAKTTQISQ